MHVVCLLSQKGGSGKTSLSLSIACAAQQFGKETLIIES